MKQYLLKSEPLAGKVEVTGKDFHYLIRVRRLKLGCSIPGFSPQGNRYILTLDKIGSDSCTFLALPGYPRNPSEDSNLIPKPGEVISINQDCSPPLNITLYQGLPKGSKMDKIVRMAIESGASRIVPLKSMHCIVKLEGKAIEPKIQRWRKIATEAAQQSGALCSPQIEPPLDISSIPTVRNNSSDSIGLLFHEKPLENSSLHRYLSGQFNNIALIIGPEGGFAGEEIDQMIQKGYHPNYLGKRVLRTETAGTYVLGAIQTIMLERGTWKPVL